MNRTKLLIGGLLSLAAAMLVLTFWPSAPRPASPPPGQAVPADAEASKATGAKPAAKAERTKRAAPMARAATREAAAAEEAPAQSEPAAGGAKAAAAEAKTPREKAMAAWESLVERVLEQKDVPPNEQAPVLKEAFDKLDKEDQMDGIRQALNLFPDEQFPALYAILYDKTENAEVLDAIFSDALNRPEELKNPLMKELVKDKSHPCFFESARILDVIGELEVKPGPTASP